MPSTRSPCQPWRWPAAGNLQEPSCSPNASDAIRKPTVEAMLSYSAGRHGQGWVYAVNTALDETGATIGPLLIAFVLYRHGTYRTGYSILLISALLTLAFVVVARLVFPVPSRLEQPGHRT